MSLSKLFHKVERKIVKALVKGMVSRGFSVHVDNGDDGLVTYMTNEKVILDNCALTDEDRIYFKNNVTNEKGMIWVIYGEGETCITDYSDNKVTNEIVDEAMKSAGVEV